MDNKMFNDILDAIIENATIEEIETIREKLNTHMIDYIYEHDVKEELHSTFDSSSCPRCQSHITIKHGKDANGKQRYFCKTCRKTYTAMTGTLLSYTKKAPNQWYLYLESLLHGDTIEQSAVIAGICEQTSLVWRHKIQSICADLTDIEPSLSGIVYLDEKLVPVNHPGTLLLEPKPKKRGISDQKRNIACAINAGNHKVIQVSERGRIHAKELLSIFENKIPSSCTVVSDSLRSYHKVMKDLGVMWIKILSGKTEKDGYTLRKINLLHSSIELFLHGYRGISDKYLRNYIGLYKMKDRYKYCHQKKVFYKLYKTLMNSICELRFKDFAGTVMFSLT